MNDSSKTKTQLINELEVMRKRVAKLEAQNAGRPSTAGGEARWLTAVTEQATEGIAVANLDGNILYTNSSWAVMHGYESGDELLGRSLSIFHTSEKLEEDVLPFLEEVKQIGHKTGEVWHVRKDGTSFLTTMTVTLLKDAQDRPYAIAGIALDITERKRIEEEFHEERTFSNAAIASLPGFFYVYNVHGKFLRWNRNLETVSGYSADEIAKMSPEEFFPLEERDNVKEVIQEVFVKGESSVEAKLLSKDGSTTDCLLTGARFEMDGVLCLAGMGLDISDRTSAEEALAEARELLEAAVAQSPSGIVVADAPNVNIRMANQAAFGIRGGDLSILTGIDVERHTANWQLCRHDGTSYPPEQLPLSRAVLQGEVTQNEEMIIRDQDGNDHWVNTNSAPIRNTKGEIIAGIVIFHDITDRRMIQEQLQAEQAFVNTIIQSMPGLFYIFEEHSARFVRRNDNWAKVTGYSEEELDTMTALDVVADRELCASRMQEVYDKGASSMENHLLTKSGEQILYYFNGHKLVIDDKTYLVGLGLDLSERHRLEEERLILERQVQHAQKLESLGVLAGGIAHDFNNLLMAILGNADLALDQLSPHAPARGNIEGVETAAKRAAELAKQMLAYSGKGRFVIETIALNEFVEEMAHLLEVSISKKAMLMYNFTDNLPTIDGDATQIRQIIMNLITNASEAIGGKSGVISLSTDVMDCDRAFLDDVNESLRAGLDEPLLEGTYVYFEVTDTGCGMDAETIAKIFDPFFTTKFTGRGLGMSAVLGIVRGHKGAIKVYSEIGRGTTFKVLFPASEVFENDSVARVRGEGVEKDWRGEGLVLIVDDEESVCTVGEQMLKRIGFDVMTASDGRQALEVFRDNEDEIVCVLLDLTMPHLDGEQTFRDIRRIRPDTKVILCSGYNMQEATQRFAGKGLAGFLQKPYSMAELKAKLMEILS